MGKVLARRNVSISYLINAATALITSFIFAKFVGIALGVGLIIMRIGSSTTFNNAESTLLNSFVSSRNRATAISSLKLMTQLPFALFAVPIGYFIDHYSPNAYAGLFGLTLFVALAVESGLFKALERKRSS